jgi:excisionase family DNA binding protein
MTEYLTLSEAKDRLRIRSNKTILKYIRLGLLPAIKIGGTRWRIAACDLEFFVEQSKVKNLR